MNEVQSAVEASAILDDGLPGRLPGELRDQEKVHGALLNKRALAWSRPSPELTERILLRASLVRPKRPAPRWPLAMAASLVLAGGLSYLAATRTSWFTPAPATPDGMTIADAGPHEPAPAPTAPPLDLSLLTRFPQRTQPGLVATFDEPLLVEARALRADTQRGIETVMSKLPIQVTMDLGR